MESGVNVVDDEFYVRGFTLSAKDLAWSYGCSTSVFSSAFFEPVPRQYSRAPETRAETAGYIKSTKIILNRLINQYKYYINSNIT